MTTTTITTFDESAGGWARSLYAFLAEKQRRSGSMRTVEGYSRMLQNFFGRLGKHPDEITAQDVFAWAHGVGLSGREPSATTIGARIACVSSFFRFLTRMGTVTSNPSDKLERPKATPNPPRGLSAEEVRQLLAAIPDTPGGLRDRAIILTLVLTGRRRAEVIGMKASDITTDGDRAFYRYRGKGGKTGRRELPRPAYDAIVAALQAVGKDPSDMAPDQLLWPSQAGSGRGLTSATFYARLQRHLKTAGLRPAGVHIFRHTAAKLRRDAGESVEDVSRFLDHSSLGTTTIYLPRLEGENDSGWRQVGEAIGAA